MTDITSALSSQITFSLPELYRRISKTGWSVTKVKYDKKEDRFLATAKNERGQEITAKGNSDTRAVANLLVQITQTNRIHSSIKESIWKNGFTDQLKEIAEAYVKAPIYDPKAAIAFKELADDSMHRSQILSQHVAVEITNNPEPYHTVEKMTNDIRKKRRLYVSSSGSENHPVWTPEQVLAFRTCFDILGYAVAGMEWDWIGDNRAFMAYAPLISANAQEALFSEVIAQSAYLNQYRAYGPQKVTIFPKILKPVQEEEGVHKNFRGLHPSQSFPPIEAPEYQHYKAEKDKPTIAHLAGVNPNLIDPNYRWQSGVEPLQPNARLDYGDPLGAKEVMDNAQIIDTEWAYLKTGEGKPDYERMKLAITNAFRAVLLSPRKDLKGNTIHYQDLQDIPAGVTDPSVYWDRLEKRRFEKNGDENHLPYARFVPELRSLLWHHHYPDASRAEIDEKTKDLIRNWLTEEQERIARKDANAPEGKKLDGFRIDLDARKAVTKRIKNYLKSFQPRMDVSAGQEAPIEMLERYPAFIGNHMKAIAQISYYVDDLLKAALEDVHNHDGSGHHFRATVMQLGIAGVGMKVASFAWLLLQPTTSEIAAIDTHIMSALGHDYNKDMNPREYGRFERELAAGRDAAGYGDIPLGAFQWGLWDHQRTGPGTHQDHSGLRVMDPTPHDKIEWHAPIPKGENPPPEWWELTKPIRDRVGEEWMENEAGKSNKETIPYQRLAKKIKIAGSIPWFILNDQRVEGEPDQAIMKHIVQTTGMTTPEIWQKIEEAGH